MSQKTDSLDLVQFSSQAEELNRLLITFSEILDQESEIIKKNQADQLSEITFSKQEISEQLNLHTVKLDKILSAHNLNLASLIDSKEFSAFPEPIQIKIQDLMVLIQQCHDTNLANGMSIQMLSNINRHALDLISGKPQKKVNLYGSTGEKTSSESQSSLGKA